MKKTGIKLSVKTPYVQQVSARDVSMGLQDQVGPGTQRISVFRGDGLAETNSSACECS
jgi:hypothetical protein